MKVPLLCLIAHAMSKPADSILGTDFGSFLINPWDYILKWSPTTDHPSPFLNVNGGLDQPIDLAHKRFYNILDPAEGYMMPNQYKRKRAAADLFNTIDDFSHNPNAFNLALI